MFLPEIELTLMAVLHSLLGETTNGHYTNIVKRRWGSTTAMEKDVENARVWSDAYTRTAGEFSSAIGRQIAEYGLRTAIQLLTR